MMNAASAFAPNARMNALPPLCWDAIGRFLAPTDMVRFAATCRAASEVLARIYYLRRDENTWSLGPFGAGHFIQYKLQKYAGQGGVEYEFWDAAAPKLLYALTGYKALYVYTTIPETPFDCAEMQRAISLATGDASFAKYADITNYFEVAPVPTNILLEAAKLAIQVRSFKRDRLSLIGIQRSWLIAEQYYPTYDIDHRLGFDCESGKMCLVAVIIVHPNMNYLYDPTIVKELSLSNTAAELHLTRTEASIICYSEINLEYYKRLAPIILAGTRRILETVDYPAKLAEVADWYARHNERDIVPNYPTSLAEALRFLEEGPQLRLLCKTKKAAE